MPETDSVVRAMTNDGAFRIVAARTTDTGQAVIAAQKLSGVLAHNMADLVTTAVLYRETMAPSQRVQSRRSGTVGWSTVGVAEVVSMSPNVPVRSRVP